MNQDEYLSSGLTLVNCALTNNPFCAFKRGGYYSVTGDSMTGKSLFGMMLFAEATRNEVFNEYEFLYDNPEDGLQLDKAEHFGQATADRIEEYASETAEEMYSKMRRRMRKGPCLGFVDSMDALTSLSELKKADEIDKAVDENKESDLSGIMSDGKAKVNSTMLRQMMKPLSETGSMLFIVSQTRDGMGQFSQKTRSGGRALRFYAQGEIWFSVKQTLKKQVRGVDREIGQLVEVAVKKTRHCAAKHKVIIPLLHEYGFDDIGSCVDWLVTNKHWKGGKKISATEFRELPRQDLISFIEEKSRRHRKLRELVGEVWDSIRNAVRPERKKRYE